MLDEQTCSAKERTVICFCFSLATFLSIVYNAGAWVPPRFSPRWLAALHGSVFQANGARRCLLCKPRSSRCTPGRTVSWAGRVLLGRGDLAWRDHRRRAVRTIHGGLVLAKQLVFGWVIIDVMSCLFMFRCFAALALTAGCPWGLEVGLHHPAGQFLCEARAACFLY